MTAGKGKYGLWQQAVRAEEDKCFWPGPKPMLGSRWGGQLRGRDEQARKFSGLVRETSLVVLNGESGVGKSSMLNLGIVPRLEKDGFEVLICRNWASSGSHADFEGLDAVEEFISSRIEQRLPEGVTSGPGFIRQLNDEYGDEAVIVLDQFEGLIRHQPKFYNEVRQWIEEVVKRYAVHIVISLRTEFMHRIRDLTVGPYKRADFTLDRISEEHWIKEIIDNGNRLDGLAAPTIESSAASAIAELWTRAEGGRAWTSVGLLHLQALLYVLWRNRAGDTITVEEPLWREGPATLTLADFIADDSRDAAELFAGALAHAVALRLDRCRDVYLNDLGGDATLAEGVVSLVTRMPDHLEAGGYKVPQERRQLASKVLVRELATLREDVSLDPMSPAGSVFTDISNRVDDMLASDGERVDFLTLPRVGLISKEDLQSQVIERAGDSDDYEVTAGPMLGMPPLAVVTEELRRYFFALAWLVESDIIVHTDADGGDTMLELVHDGFSRGLKAWASLQSEGPERAPHRLTASVGEVFDWRASEEQQGRSPDTENGWLTSANLRWRSCRVVGADFWHRVFVNCDFRETTFENCTFEGVTFVNCLMDGVSFVGGVVRGKVTPTPSEWDGEKAELPSFIVEAPDLVETMNRYLDSPVLTSQVGSWTSGRPARPISAGRAAAMKNSVTDAFRFEDWDKQSGGLVMYGGRLSSLMFSDCQLADGTVSFRHVAGTSLEFAEQTSGSIELFDVAIRGFTVSPPVGSMPQDEDLLKINVSESALQNVWFSTPIKGTADIRNSVVWQLFSASKRSGGFSVKLTNSAHLGLVNGFDGGVPATSPKNFDAECYVREDVTRFAQKVDYQSLANLRAHSPEPPQE